MVVYNSLSRIVSTYTYIITCICSTHDSIMYIHEVLLYIYYNIYYNISSSITHVMCTYIHIYYNVIVSTGMQRALRDRAPCIYVYIAYIYIYICTYIHIHVCIYIYTHAHIDVCIYIYIYIYTYCDDGTLNNPSLWLIKTTWIR